MSAAPDPADARTTAAADGHFQSTRGTRFATLDALVAWAETGASLTYTEAQIVGRLARRGLAATPETP